MNPLKPSFQSIPCPVTAAASVYDLSCFFLDLLCTSPPPCFPGRAVYSFLRFPSEPNARVCIVAHSQDPPWPYPSDLRSGVFFDDALKEKKEQGFHSRTCSTNIRSQKHCWASPRMKSVLQLTCKQGFHSRTCLTMSPRTNICSFVLRSLL